MFIASWGDNSKKIADAGIDECNNCNNYSIWEVHEVSKKASVFFVPVVKFKKKTFLVCTVCNAGYELNDEEKKNILKRTVEIPDNNVSAKIWQEVDSDFVKFMKENENSEFNLSEWPEKEIKNLKSEGYMEDDIEYVLGIYLNKLKKAKDRYLKYEK